MKTLWRRSLADWLVVGAIVADVAMLCLPDSATRKCWELKRRALDWKKEPPTTLDDPSRLSIKESPAGTWRRRGHLNWAALEIAEPLAGRSQVESSTGGCMGTCALARTASIRDGVVTLDGAVAEYTPRTYDTLYLVSVEGWEYLLPAPCVPEFERSLDADTEDWTHHVFRRVEVPRTPAK